MSDILSDHRDWQTVRLGDVVNNINENTYNPRENGLERSVGLEHLDPDCLRISRWDPIADDSSFTRRFRKGQVLFGRRRVYLRKAALAEFDGICSSDIYTLEANPEKLLPELLPFIVQSDALIEYAISRSAGTMSPRVKWASLGAFEVRLPPMEIQRRIANVLIAVENCIFKGERLVATAERVKQVLMRELFRKGIGHDEFRDSLLGMIPRTWTIESIRNIGDFKTGPFGTMLKADEYSSGEGVPLICMRDIKEGFLEIDDKTPRIPPSVVERLQGYLLETGDLVFGRKGNINRSAIVKDIQNGWLLGTDGIRMRLSKSFHAPFVSYFFQKDDIQSWLLHNATGTTMASMNQKILQRISIPTPPLREQLQIADILTSCDEMIATARASVAATKALKMRLVNELLNSPVGVGS